MNTLRLLQTGVLALAAASAFAAEPGPQAWDKLHQVLSHPRCANCHVGSDNLPVWSGPSYGPKARPHGMNINGGSSRMGAETGLLCTSCHAPGNGLLPHSPPGAPVWLLAPVAMQWYGKRSAEICAQLKDPARNGGRTLSQVAEHIEHDKLVAWGWQPGPGREPAPYSSREAGQFVRDWAQAGAPCPAP